MGYTSLYLQLIKEWDCIFFNNNPSSFNEFVVGSQSSCGICPCSSCRSFPTFFEVLDSSCKSFLCSCRFPCPAYSKLFPSCSKPCLSCRKLWSSCSFYFYSSPKANCVLGFLKLIDLVVCLLTGVTGDLVFVLGLTSSFFPSLGTISSFFLGNSSIIIGNFVEVCCFSCPILMLFQVLKYLTWSCLLPLGIDRSAQCS